MLLCENETGYRNLSYLVSQAFVDGFYIKPRIDLDLLRRHSEGLIACRRAWPVKFPAAWSAATMTGPRNMP